MSDTQLDTSLSGSIAGVCCCDSAYPENSPRSYDLCIKYKRKLIKVEGHCYDKFPLRKEVTCRTFSRLQRWVSYSITLDAYDASPDL